MSDQQHFTDFLPLYEKTLLEDVMPFWMKNAIDAESGCINNCIDDSGKVLSRDRYLWSQGRALWTFSALYNRIEPRTEWLETARGLFRYLAANGRDEEGRWMFLLDETGTVKERDTSIFVDGFVMAGMSEYLRATGSPAAAEIALKTYENVVGRIRRPGSYNIAPYDLPAGMKSHGINMAFSFFFNELGKTLEREDIRDSGHALATELLETFYIPEVDAIVEFVGETGNLLDQPLGRVCVPGHVIECMWFLISIFEERGDEERIRQCCEMIKRHLELGWDSEYGGIRLAFDVQGHTEVAWDKHDCKPWWVQVEALVATVFAARYISEAWPYEWHKRVKEYAFSHYPVDGGEWTQWLNRRGEPSSTAALPVKDPFHLPRALIYLIERIKLWEVE